jgi:hypothetical protein
MSVNVGEIVSDVVPAPEPPSQEGKDHPEWRRAAEMRRMQTRCQRDSMRTSADGFDD